MQLPLIIGTTQEEDLIEEAELKIIIEPQNEVKEKKNQASEESKENR